MKPLSQILFITLWLLPSPVRGDQKAETPTPVLEAVPERSGPTATGTAAVLQANAKRLREQFDQWLQEPEGYRRRALRECGVFPEGRFYPFAIPALAYANVGLSDTTQRAQSAARMRSLIDLLIATVVEDVSPPGGDLKRLARYNKQGTRLATLNLTLACYALISDDDRYGKLHDHVSRLLRKALVEKAGQPLESYPEYTWYFDTIMALVSLEFYDRAHGQTQAQELLSRHLAWVRDHGTDAETGLPIAYAGGLPRGCDISMQICLLQQVDARAAHRLYTNYVRHHWANLGFVAGFREWPHSKGSPFLGDVDSGPLIFGIGPTATGVGLGAVQAVNDTNRLNILAAQLRLIPELLGLIEQNGLKLFGGAVQPSNRYVTGFLYGDAVLFYAITWVQYPAGQAPVMSASGNR